MRLTRFHLFVAFAFTVMADPVSSVTYAIEAALAEADGELQNLVPTMALVLVTIAIVAGSYHQLIGRFPNGGGGAEGLAAAFGEGFVFLPVGALLVDFALTIAVSCAAGTSALIAFLPGLAPYRTWLALGLAALVAVGVSLGHRGRVVFATATLLFIGLALAVSARGFAVPRGDAQVAFVGDLHALSVILAVPLGMALATGVEAPSNAIAQLDQLDRRGRRAFGRLTIWLMLAIVAMLTLLLSVVAVRLGVGLPGSDSTLLAEVARQATREDAMFVAFQAASLALLLAAAASSYLAGSGLLEALARHGVDGEGLLPRSLGQTNRFFVPVAGVAVLLGVSAGLIAITGGRDQDLVHYYAVAVFASFLGAVLACAVLTYRERRLGALAVNVAGALLVSFVLVLNLRRVDPLLSLGAAGLISLALWRTWVARGRPGGVAEIVS